MESSNDLTDFLLLFFDFLQSIFEISIGFLENLVDFEDTQWEFLMNFSVGISPSLFLDEFKIDLLEVFLNLLAVLLLRCVLSLFSFHYVFNYEVDLSFSELFLFVFDLFCIILLFLS